MQFTRSCNSYICEVSRHTVSWLSVNIVQRIRRLVILELSSFLPLLEFLQYEFLVVFLLVETILHAVVLVLLWVFVGVVNSIRIDCNFSFLISEFRFRILECVFETSCCLFLQPILATLRQVSLYRQVSLFLRLSDLETSWTSIFLVQSDKLVIVLHLLLAPVGTVVTPAEHEVVRHQSPTPGALRCFPLLSHRLKL